MIHIVYGDDYASSREYVSNLQKNLGNFSRVDLDISDTAPEQLISAVGTFDVFGGAPFVVLDVSKAGRMNVKPFVEAFSQVPQDSVLVVLSSKEFSKSNAFLKRGLAAKARIVPNVKPKTSNVFDFVDSVFSGNRKKSYKELQKISLAAEDPFYIFSMLLYGLRNVAFLKFSSPNARKMAPFVRSKFISFATTFSEEAVSDLYAEFYIMDKASKLGQIPPELLITLAVEKVLSFF